MKKISTVGAVTRNTKTPIKPVLDPNRFSTWNKLLLTLATVFNLIYRAKKYRSNKSQYTKEDVCLSQNFMLNLAQNKAFSSTINALKRTQMLDDKSKLRNLNPIIDQNGLLRSSGRLLFAPTELEIEKCPIISDTKKISQDYTLNIRTEFVLIKQQNRSKHSYNNATTSLDFEKHYFQYNTDVFCVAVLTEEYSTNNGPTSCIPLPSRRNQMSVCQHRTGLFRPVLYCRQTRQYRETLWTYFYMPCYPSSPFGNLSRFKHRHLPQCISTVHHPKMPTYFIVHR